MSMPLWTTWETGTRVHASAVCRDTATKVHGVVVGEAVVALSIHGMGGVCSVVTTGIGSVGAMATGRWCRELFWTMSRSSRSASRSMRWR